MVRHIPLHRNPKVYEDFYCNQNGQGLPVFIGGRSQGGRGIGSFFSGLGRMVLPWLKTGGKALLREGVGTGLHVANDALAGRNIGESFRDRAKESGRRLLQGAVDHVSTNQSGSGVKRRRRYAPPGEPFYKRIKLANPRIRSHKKGRKTKKRYTGRRRSNKKTKKNKKKYSDIFG